MGAQRQGEAAVCVCGGFLTAALIGWAYKSEVTLLVPSISRLFYMGNFALMGEPSMEPS